jgi:hypothetical protein
MGNHEPGILIGRIAMWILVGGGVGYLIGKGKGKGSLGFILGLCLGLLGWIIIAVIPAERQGGSVRPARFCRSCRRRLPPKALHCKSCGPQRRASAPS